VKKLLSLPVRIAVILYLVALLVLATGQRSILFYPSHSYITLQEAHAHKALRELPVRTGDGLQEMAWYAPATTKPYTIVFFHGNGDCLATASEAAYPYIEAGYGFLVAEYRGYSGLPGSPTEQGLYADARAVLDGLATQGVKPEKILLMGHSLGTGVAVQMASEHRAGGLILLAPYLSIPKLAQLKYPIFPVYYLARDRFNSESKIAAIHAPLLIVNGTHDQLIPPAQGKKLYELAQEPKEYDSLPGRGHNDVLEDAAPTCLRWMEKLGGRSY